MWTKTGILWTIFVLGFLLQHTNSTTPEASNAQPIAKTTGSTPQQPSTVTLTMLASVTAAKPASTSPPTAASTPTPAPTKVTIPAKTDNASPSTKTPTILPESQNTLPESQNTLPESQNTLPESQSPKSDPTSRLPSTISTSPTNKDTPATMTPTTLQVTTVDNSSPANKALTPGPQEPTTTIARAASSASTPLPVKTSMTTQVSTASGSPETTKVTIAAPQTRPPATELPKIVPQTVNEIFTREETEESSSNETNKLICKELFKMYPDAASCRLSGSESNNGTTFPTVTMTVSLAAVQQINERIMKREPTAEPDSSPIPITLVAILSSCGALLSIILIFAVYCMCHHRSYRKNQQHLTEELQTVENGYHDNPTLEVMEVQPEMQEKKPALNGECNDSWIVPFDNLAKEDIPDEEDTHL